MPSIHVSPSELKPPQVASAELLSRIDSPTNPAAVDVYLEYHYRMRYESVEFFCNVYYRAQPSVTETKLTLSTPRGPSKMNGWSCGGRVWMGVCAGWGATFGLSRAVRR